MLDVKTLTGEQLSTLDAAVAEEKARRNATAARVANYVTALDHVKADAKAAPVVPFEPVPSWPNVAGHPPRARVLYAEKVWENVGEGFLTLAPFESLEWQEATPVVPEPIDPENGEIEALDMDA